MNEIKCPKCGEIFTVDESAYESIVQQVKEQEIDRRVREKQEQFEAEKALALQQARLEADMEIQKLNTVIDKADTERDLAVTQAVRQKEQELFEKEQELTALRNRIESQAKDRELQEQRTREGYEQQLRMKDEEIERYKDLKARQSVKMLGETLEQHCENEFNRIRPIGFRHAYFEKDNDASGGSKGDYIFREQDEDGTEIISIMFEMKNEADASVNRHKNEDFFDKLDKDRRDKNCEYAVLVSLLESDSEYYNGGIVDVSHRYPKMYVVRPQFFIPIITILRNAALRSLEDRRALSLERARNIDITRFEQELQDFKDRIGYNYRIAGDKFKSAIEEIDKTIATLQKVKDNLLSTEKNFRIANDKAEELTIKRLTKDNPTMQARFDALKADKK